MKRKYSKTKPTMEEYNNMYYQSQYYWRKQFPGEYPLPKKQSFKDGKPTLEEFNKLDYQRKSRWRQRFPEYYPPARPYNKKKITTLS